MLYLAIILAVFAGIGVYMLTRKTVAPPVITTSEDEKPAGWMDPTNDLDAYISAQMSAGISASIAASTSISAETSIAGNATKTRKPRAKKSDSAE